MAANPAGLGLTRDVPLQASLVLAHPDGDFHNRNGDGGSLDNELGFVPDAGLAFPFGDSPATVGA